MVKAIKIIGFKEMDPLDLDGRKFLLQYEFGYLENSDFQVEFESRVDILFSGRLEAKWGASVEPILTHTLNELRLALRQNKLVQINEIKLWTDNVPVNPPTEPKVTVGDIIRIEDKLLS